MLTISWGTLRGLLWRLSLMEKSQSSFDAELRRGSSSQSNLKEVSLHLRRPSPPVGHNRVLG